MLIVQQRARRAIHVPLFMITVTALIAAASAHRLIANPGVGTAVMSVLTVAFFVFSVFDLRVFTARGDELVIRGPRQDVRLARAACAFSVRVSYGTRGGATYTVYVNDGVRSHDLCDHWSAKSADRALARAERALLDASAADVAAQLALQRSRWESAQQDAQARIDVYYRSPAWRRAKWLVVGGVAIYVLVMIAWQALR